MTDTKQIETTVGVVVSGKVAAKAKKVSGELAVKYSWQRKEMEKHEEKREEYLETKVSTSVSQKTECRLVAWQIVDQFSLYNYRNGQEPVFDWTVYGDRVDWVKFSK